MCEQTRSASHFDPDLCPLLEGLSPEAKQKRMREDPIIRNCIAAIEGAGEVSRETAKLAAAYNRRQKKIGRSRSTLCCDDLAAAQALSDR
jgi:hypothetical protein